MHFTWVNHASFVVRSSSVALICDPWLDGPAFDNGWSLISKTKFRYEDFANISHIFFSHEHPDHFSPPNVRRIPQEFRRNITVLFHETRDKRLVNLCRSWGFKIMELPEDTWVWLGDDIFVMCGRQGLIDSWLAFSGEGQTILNMNDCVFEHDSELKHVHQLVPSPDVLFTQFSYANWVGNPDDQASHRRHAQQKLKEMARQVKILEPSSLVPCASFVWFSHQENHFANRGVNTIWDVYDYTSKRLGVKTVVLYPGDEWVPGREHDSTEALNRYRDDYAALENAPLTAAEPVPLGKLREAHQTYRRKLLLRNKPYLLRAIPSAVAYLTDLDVKVRISIPNGIKVIADPRIAPCICLSSEALQYCYLWDWGGDTLAVNGRFTVPRGANPRKFFLNFRVPMYNSSGLQLDMPLIADIGKRYIARKLGVADTRPSPGARAVPRTATKAA